MQIDTIPYFLKNEEWYYYDDNDSKRSIKLTKKAPAEAVKSYEEFYEELESVRLTPELDKYR